MIVCKFNNEIKSGETDQLSGVTLQRDSYRNENPGVVLPQPHRRERARQTRGYCVVVFFLVCFVLFQDELQVLSLWEPPAFGSDYTQLGHAV